MSLPAEGEPCYLVEWYRPEATREALELTAARLETCAASLRASGMAVRLVTVLAVPTDEVVFAVFAAAASDGVEEACRQAGLPTERLTAATRIEAERLITQRLSSGATNSSVDQT